VNLKYKVGDIIRPDDLPLTEDLVVSIDTSTSQYTLCRIKGGCRGMNNKDIKSYGMQTVHSIGIFIRKSTRAEKVLYGKV